MKFVWYNRYQIGGTTMSRNSKIRENVKIYEEIIQNLCELFIKLDIHKDPVKIYENFIYMYTNGFLSNNGTYSDILPESCINLELNGYIPMDITGIILLYGYGVCRHTSDFLSHIYQTLRYDSSQLFTYHPTLNIQVDNYSEKFLINSEFQKYIDEALIGLDLFSKEEYHLTRIFDNIVVRIDYLPENGSSLMNHTMNIVLDKKGLLHILDTRFHCVGERIDINRIRLNYQGLTHTDFIQKDCFFHTYYGTNYFRGLGLLEHDTNIGIDMLTSVVCGESCRENIRYYEEFQLKNQKNYNRITDNINKLVKKL